MWPTLLDLTRDECKRILRRLELDAYSTVLSALRAQGDLTKDKKKILQDLQRLLSISTERHRAEVRRAVNDERLATIADTMAGPNVSSEWVIEGRRLVPLMPRLVPQTAFTVTANSVANMQAEKNLSMASPSQTGMKEVASCTSTTPTSSMASSKLSRPSSPASNVVVLPSGMSIHIKGGLNTEEDDVGTKKRRRSSSTESVVISRTTPSSSVPTPKITYTTTASNTLQGITPMRITFTKSPQKTNSTVTPSQKVILVSSQSGQASSSPNILHKSITVPVVKTSTGAHSSAVTTTTSTLTHPRTSIVVPASSSASTANGSLGSIATVATSHSGTPVTTVGGVSNVATATTAFLTSTLNMAKPRPKTISRPKAPQQTTITKSGIVIPVGSQSVHPSPTTIQGLQLKGSAKPTIQIKQEGSMKIITQGTSGNTSKILPKPASGTGPPVVVVTTSAPTSITMVARTTSSLGGSLIPEITRMKSGQMTAGKVLNITTHGGKVIATTTTRPSGANVVTVNPKTLQLTAVKSSSGTTVTTCPTRLTTTSGTKPNVIVVQKTPAKRAITPTGTMAVTHTVRTPPTSTSVISSPFEKELVSFIQRQDTHKIVQGPHRIIERKVLPRQQVVEVIKRPQQIIRQKSEPVVGEQKSSLLAELIQAVGIVPESSSGSTSGQESPSVQEEPLAPAVVLAQTSTADSTATGHSKVETLPVNQWLEYDIADDQVQQFSATEPTDASAIKALLDLQSNSQAKVKDIATTRHSSVDLGQLPSPLGLQQSDLYAIEQAASILGSSTTKDPSASDTLQYVQSPGLVDKPLSTQLQGSIAVSSAGTSILSPQSGTREVRLQLASTESSTQLPAGLTQEMLGELDPQTGVFYTTSRSDVPRSTSSTASLQGTQSIREVEIQAASDQPGPGHTQTVQVVQQSSTQKPVVVSLSVPATADAKTIDLDSSVIKEQLSKPVDIFSSALAQAQIDLDPYQFIDDDEPAFQQKLHTSGSETTPPGNTTSGTLMSILNPPPTVSFSTASATPDTGTTSSAQEALTSLESPLLGDVMLTPSTSPSTQLITTTAKPKTTFIPLQDAAKKSFTTTHINVIRQTPPASVQAVNTTNVTVAVEPSGLDTSHMKMEDFTSQRLEERVDYGRDLSYGEEGGLISSPPGTSSSSDSQGDTHPTRISKRKRKPPPAPDDSPPQSTIGGWIRAALGLLHRVSRFRGATKEKGEMNAASWFTHPVSPEEAPDYYKIIKTPMDFSTIKKKLENTTYLTWEEFHTDMMLVRDNCHKYNPPGHEVRKDCDEVFAFYQMEYEKIMEKWQQRTLTLSPSSKKIIKLDRSPVRC